MTTVSVKDLVDVLFIGGQSPNLPPRKVSQCSHKLPSVGVQFELILFRLLLLCPIQYQLKQPMIIHAILAVERATPTSVEEEWAVRGEGATTSTSFTEV